MASLLDSVTVTRVFSLPITSSISPASKVPSVSARRISPVPEFRGLKASRKSSVTQSASLGTNLGSRFARGGRIVCEAQDTTAAPVEGIQLNFFIFNLLLFCVKINSPFVIYLKLSGHKLMVTL